MIPLKELLAVLVSQDVVAVKVFDSYGNLILMLGDADTPKTSKEIATTLENSPVVKACKIIEIRGANQSILKSNWRNAYNWRVVTGDQAGSTGAVQQVVQPQQSMAASMMEMFQLMQMMTSISGANKGGMDVEAQKRIMQLELEKFKAENSLDLKKWESSQNNFWNQYGGFVPAAMMMMGKSTEEIKNVMQLGAMSNMQGPPNLGIGSGTQKGESITKHKFEELEKMHIDEKNKLAAELEEKLFKMISAEHFIMLLELLIEKPERAAKAIAAADAGMI